MVNLTAVRGKWANRSSSYALKALARKLVSVSLVAISCIAFSGVSAEQSPSGNGDLPVIRIGYPVWVGFGPFFLAQEKGFFKQNGVAVEMVKIDDPRLRWAAVATGDLDGIASGIPTVPLYIKPEFSVKCVLPLDESAGADGIVALKQIKRIQDLRGKSVAYNQGAITEYYLSFVLEQAGLRIADVKGVNMKPDDAAAAFFAGRVDAAVTWEPWLSKAKSAEHGHVLHDTSAAPGVLVDCLAFPKSVIDSRKRAIQGVIKGWYQAIEHIRSNRDESVKIMAKKVGGWLEKPEDFAATLAGVRYFDRNYAVKYFAGANAPAQKIAQDVLNLWIRQGKVDNNLKPSDILDYSFVQ